MRIKSPGGNVASWTLLWMVTGTWMTYSAARNGQPVLAVVFAILPISCGLMWLQVKSAKWLVASYLALAVIGCVLIMTKRGFSVPLLIRTLIGAYGVWIMARWQGSPASIAATDDVPFEKAAIVPETPSRSAKATYESDHSNHYADHDWNRS